MALTVHLGLLEGAGLIQIASIEPDLEYLFRHVLIQEAAYSTLLRAQRRQWHLATARVIESACRSETETVSLAPILARHFSLAGDRPRALHYLVIAADAAFDHYANVEAASFYGQALEIANAREAEYDPQLMRLLFSRHGLALELTSHFDAALDNYRSMEAAAQLHSDNALELAAVMARAKIHSTANTAQDLPQAVGLLERASALAHSLGDPVAEARINWTLLLNSSMAGGDAAQSIAYGQHALELARSHNERELMAFVLTDLWFALAGAGRWDEARAAVQNGYVLARERQLQRALAIANALRRVAAGHAVVEQQGPVDLGLRHRVAQVVRQRARLFEQADGLGQVLGRIGRRVYFRAGHDGRQLHGFVAALLRRPLHHPVVVERGVEAAG